MGKKKEKEREKREKREKKERKRRKKGPPRGNKTTIVTVPKIKTNKIANKIYFSERDLPPGFTLEEEELPGKIIFLFSLSLSLFFLPFFLSLFCFPKKKKKKKSRDLLENFSTSQKNIGVPQFM